MQQGYLNFKTLLLGKAWEDWGILSIPEYSEFAENSQKVWGMMWDLPGGHVTVIAEVE